ncbi:unnamed protein product [Peronospora belbahrii]|uniref:Uncharacterized protein n=1 Tax=Peronospora belbahrii TaxID=622444 RepID=A0ABN8D3M6_9STRA|nr:unnamed protein product [Peronospora belbahrii]
MVAKIAWCKSRNSTFIYHYLPKEKWQDDPATCLLMHGAQRVTARDALVANELGFRASSNTPDVGNKDLGAMMNM